MNSLPSGGYAGVILALLLLAACGGGGPDGAKLPALPRDPQQNPPPESPPEQPGVLQFGTPSVGAAESAGSATVTITRSGGSDGAVSVKIGSVDGSATAAQDYVAVDTLVTFAAGETTKSVQVTISDDDMGEDAEAFSLELSEPEGGATLGENVAATVTIESDDAPAAPSITIAAEPKRLIFTWSPSAGVTRYELLVDRAGNGEFEVVPVKISSIATTVAVDIPVHGLDWAKSQFQLQACNEHGCASSEPHGLDSELMLGAISKLSVDLPPEDYARLGGAVALSGDGKTLVVGAPGENFQDNTASGVVYVFERAAAGWSDPVRLPIGGAGLGGAHGYSVALDFDGSTLVVGAPYATPGRAHIFERIGGRWVQSTEPLQATADPTAVFGFSVALSDDGNTIAVGAPGNVNAIGYAGAAYLFVRHGTTWSDPLYLQARDPESADKFGASVALDASGTILAVGAPEDDLPLPNGGGNLFDAGSVTIFRLNSDTWTRERELRASNASVVDEFGSSIDLSDDGSTLAVGAPVDSVKATGVHNTPPVGTGELMGSGAVYVFARDSDWSEQAYVKATKAARFDYFGSDVALSGDGNTLAVGAPYEDGNAIGVGGLSDDNVPVPDAGAVYTYTRSGATWSSQAYVKASDTAALEHFGISVSLSQDGDTLAAGAPAGDSGSNGQLPGIGDVYVY
jgi:hypothetical protein